MDNGVTPAPATLRKEERICGKKDIAALISEGRWGSYGHFRFCCLSPGKAAFSRIMVSVPKKYFKRAVKRNLLKRRIREAYRKQKDLLSSAGVDILFQYSSQEIIDSMAVHEEIGAIMSRIGK